MDKLRTAGTTTMWQRLQLLTRLLGLFLSRYQGMALLERVQASSLSENDRALVTRIMRVTLQLPDAPEDEPSAPDAPWPARPTPQGKATRPRHAATTSCHRQRDAS
jgi:hypothetical protein